MLLKVEQLDVSYGGLRALSNVNVEVEQGEFVAIIGPNGAGKTTFFKTISGIVTPIAGRITYDGKDLLSMPLAARAHLGIAHVPEGRQVFNTLTVQNNLEIGGMTAAGRRDRVKNFERVFELFPRLWERREQLAGTLSGGEQQMLAIARGLVSSPRLLMLDEPSMGLSPTLVDTIFECIEKIHAESHLTVLLVEQRAAEALSACNRGYVLDRGNVVLEGPHEELLKDSRIQNAYLGI